jgi:hypothetical protein
MSSCPLPVNSRASQAMVFIIDLLQMSQKSLYPLVDLRKRGSSPLPELLRHLAEPIHWGSQYEPAC